MARDPTPKRNRPSGMARVGNLSRFATPEGPRGNLDGLPARPRRASPLERARTDADIIAAAWDPPGPESASVTAAATDTHHRDPTALPPDGETLAAWLPECPAGTARAELRGLDPEAAAAFERAAERHGLAAVGWRWLAFPDGLRAMVPVPGGGAAWEPLATVHRRWADTDPDTRPPHPLGPLLAAWRDRPPKVRTKGRADPILPAVRVSRDAARLAVGGLLADPAGPVQLALIPTPEGVAVPLLDLMDGAGVPIMSRGRGAGLAARLAVACFVLPEGTRADVRRRWTPTVRELRDFCFPRGWRRGATGRRAGDWDRMRAALRVLNDAMVPDGRGGYWRPFRPWREPGAAAALDDRLDIELWLPPGTRSGPRIDRRELALLGVDSGPRFRAYIGVHSVAWEPGRTQRPVPRVPGRWGWSRDRRDYRVFDTADRERVAFGAGGRKNRTRREVDAPFEALPGIEIVSRRWVERGTGRGGWLILPRDAAQAVGGRGGREG